MNKLSKEELASRIYQGKLRVAPGRFYRNIKTKEIYMVKDIVLCSETLNQMVVYETEYPITHNHDAPNLLFVRNIDEFLEKFEDEA